MENEMIYTVTLNPAIDLVASCGEIKLGEVNRTSGEEIFFGGKGINVSLVLAQLGVRSCALGFVAGFTGEAIEKGVAAAGVQTDFVRAERGFSRINMKIRSVVETEINGQGPDISKSDLDKLMQKLDGLSDGDVLVLAGSVPASVPRDIYRKIMKRLSDRDIRIVVDACGELLLNTTEYRPFLVKPNIHELGDMFGVKLTAIEQVAEYAEKLQKMGARNVLVSMAGDGALLLAEDENVYRCGVCRGKVRNSVGAGDSMLAGFIAGVDKGYDHALKLGTACGGATAFSDGLAEKNEIERLLSEL